MLRRKRLILAICLISILLLPVFFIRQKYVLPILMYHSVSHDAKEGNRLTVSVDSFRRQMSFFKKFHYNVLSLETAVDLIREKKKLPPRTVVITFDDGYKDNYTYAFPILKKYNLPATIFVIVNEVGRQARDRLSWEEIKIMQTSGIINFGSHTLGPVPLKEIKSDEELKRQIFDSKRILEKRLARRVNLFSYPGGGFNEKIRQMVINAGYKAAVTTSPGRSYPDWDLFALKRLRISSTSDNLFVFWVETSGFYTFLKEHRDKD